MFDREALSSPNKFMPTRCRHGKAGLSRVTLMDDRGLLASEIDRLSHAETYAVTASRMTSSSFGSMAKLILKVSTGA